MCAQLRFRSACIFAGRNFDSQGRLLPDCADAQTELFLRWLHMTEGMVSHIVTQLYCIQTFILLVKFETALRINEYFNFLRFSNYTVNT